MGNKKDEHDDPTTVASSSHDKDRPQRIVSILNVLFPFDGINLGCRWAKKVASGNENRLFRF
jgi:hypothetical protein